MTGLPGRGTEDGAPRYALVIPAFNEARGIDAVLREAVAVGPPLIVLVDDGSTDDTAAHAEAFPVLLIRHRSNRGKAASLANGFREALRQGVQGVVTMDGDGQHRAADIPRLLDAAARRPGWVVVGSRMHDAAAFPNARYRANRIANFWISWAAGQAIEDSQSGFRYYPASLLRQLNLEDRVSGRFVLESEILIEAARRGHRIGFIAIAAIYDAQAQRPSHFRPVADIAAIVRMVAWKLISRGFFLPGLIRATRERRTRRCGAGEP